jgi:enamine deaminase RidA (YjgF/YER057c/UK114 family)
MRHHISSGSSFETEIGYSRAVVDGNWVFIAGTTGFDYESMSISDQLLEQAEQCMRNIAGALQEAGSGWEDVVRVRYIFPRVEDFRPCWPVFRRYFEKVRPAATMISAALSDVRMKLEIEVTALKRS